MKPQISLRACWFYMLLLCFSFAMISAEISMAPGMVETPIIGVLWAIGSVGAFFGHFFAGPKGAVIGGLGIMVASLVLLPFINLLRGA